MRFFCNGIIFHCNDDEDDDDQLFYINDCFVMLTMQCSGMSGLLIKSQQKGQILEQSVYQRHCFVVDCVIWGVASLVLKSVSILSRKNIGGGGEGAWSNCKRPFCEQFRSSGLLFRAKGMKTAERNVV